MLLRPGTRYIQDTSSKSVKEHSLDLSYPALLLLLSAAGNNDIPKADGNIESLKNKDQMYFSDTSCNTNQWKENKM